MRWTRSYKLTHRRFRVVFNHSNSTAHTEPRHRCVAVRSAAPRRRRRPDGRTPASSTVSPRFERLFHPVHALACVDASLALVQAQYAPTRCKCRLYLQKRSSRPCNLQRRRVFVASPDSPKGYSSNKAPLKWLNAECSDRYASRFIAYYIFHCHPFQSYVRNHLSLVAYSNTFIDFLLENYDNPTGKAYCLINILLPFISTTRPRSEMPGRLLLSVPSEAWTYVSEVSRMMNHKRQNIEERSKLT